MRRMRLLLSSFAVLLAATAIAVAASGPANYSGIYGQGLHGAPKARMGCDGSTPQDCAMGVTPFDQNGNANDSTHPVWTKAGAGADVCQDPNVAKSSAVVNIGAAATTKIVDVSGSTAIYVCSFHFTLAGTTPTFVFKSGTHTTTDCDTGAASLSGTYAPTSGLVLAQGGSGVLLATAGGKQLCGTTAGSGSSAQGILTYVQQ